MGSKEGIGSTQEINSKMQGYKYYQKQCHQQVIITILLLSIVIMHCSIINESDKEECNNNKNVDDLVTSSPSSNNKNTTLMALIFINTDSFLNYISTSPLTISTVSKLHFLLQRYAGVPQQSLPTVDEICLSIFAVIMTLIVYFFAFGKRHVRRRKALADDLRLAQLQVHFLEEKLLLATTEEIQRHASQKKGEIRLFMDGAFDMMHYGHMNAFRLARSLGTHLIVGVNSDESIGQCKGPPLMNDQERLTMVEGCKFVDEVVPGCPYIMNKEYLDYVIQKFQVDYVIHGDDPCIVNGKDVYATAKERGKYQTIPRTEGVSTTDIVGRMLLMSKDHHYSDQEASSSSISSHNAVNRSNLLGQQSKFLTTSRMLRLFSAGVKAPEKHMRVIYVDGAWDMFHCGHVSFLNQAKKRGDYLIVGIHGDAIVNEKRGCNLPLMNLHERVLSVLGCRYVDDVLIDAPYIISCDMINSLHITEVVHGSNSDNSGDNIQERYDVPIQMSILNYIPSPSDFSLGHILTRIQKNQEVFQKKIDKKMKAEQEFYDNKYKRTEQL